MEGHFWWEMRALVQWRIQERGPGGPRTPLFLEQTETFFWRPPPPPFSKGLDNRPPPLSQYLDPALPLCAMYTEQI